MMSYITNILESFDKIKLTQATYEELEEISSWLKQNFYIAKNVKIKFTEIFIVLFF